MLRYVHWFFLTTVCRYLYGVGRTLSISITLSLVILPSGILISRSVQANVASTVPGEAGSVSEPSVELGMPPDVSAEEMGWFDLTESYFSNAVHDFSTYVDHSIAKDEDEEPLVNRSYLRLRYKAGYSHYGYFGSEERISVRIDLPHVQHDWNIIFETDPDDYYSLESKQRDLTTTDSSGVTDGAIGGFRLQDEQLRNWKTNFDIGVKIKLPLDPFTRVEAWRVGNFLDNWTTRLKQKFFYYDSIGGGSLTELNFYYAVNESHSKIFKTSTSAQYLYNDDEWELLQQFLFFDRISDKHMMEYSTGVSVDPRNSDEMTNYWLSAAWHQKIYKNWLYLTITPQVDIPREYDYKINPGIRLELEAFFSKKRNIDRLNRIIPSSTRAEN